MKTILTISIALNIILIYNLGKYKQTIDKKDKFINKWISKEKEETKNFYNICQDCEHVGIGRGHGCYAINYCEVKQMEMPSMYECEDFKYKNINNINKERNLAREFREEVGKYIPKDLGKDIEFDNNTKKEG